jgi:hypothetical protein
MKILMIDSDRREGSVLAEQFRARGHEVVRCFPHPSDGVCVGVHSSHQCPVESLGCDVALVVRDVDRPPHLQEMGAVCAVRRHIPLIEAYGHGDGPFADWATPTGTAVIEAVEEHDSGLRPRLVEAVERALADLPAVARLGRLPTVAVRKQGDRLGVTIDLPAGVKPADEDAIVTWAVRAVREHDPHTSTADAVVHRHSS